MMENAISAEHHAIDAEYIRIMYNDDLNEIRAGVATMPKIRDAFDALIEARAEYSDQAYTPNNPTVLKAWLLYMRLFIDECNARLERSSTS